MNAAVHAFIAAAAAATAPVGGAAPLDELSIVVEGHLDEAGEALAEVFGYGCRLSNKPEEAAAVLRRFEAMGARYEAAMDEAEAEFGREMRVRHWVSECRTFMNEERVRAALETAQREIDQASALIQNGKTG